MFKQFCFFQIPSDKVKMSYELLAISLVLMLVYFFCIKSNVDSNSSYSKQKNLI